MLPEALETWSLTLLQKLLPRHMQIIFDINQDFLDEVSFEYPDNIDKMRNMSIISEGPIKSVRMANLAVIGSHSINGVAALHTEIVKKDIFKDFYEMMPDRFNNKTNGVTPRRWIKEANFDLFKHIASKIGYDFIKDLDQIKKIEEYVDDKRVCK